MAAASADPPAMPPATGMPLRMAMCTGSMSKWVSTSRAARRARLSPFSGTPAASGPETVTPQSAAAATVTSS